MGLTIAVATCLYCKGLVKDRAYRIAGTKSGAIAYWRTPYCSIPCAIAAAEARLSITPDIPLFLQRTVRDDDAS